MIFSSSPAPPVTSEGETSTMKKSPSVNSSISLFADLPNGHGGSSSSENGGHHGLHPAGRNGYFKRSPSTNSNLSLAPNVRLNGSMVSPPPGKKHCANKSQLSRSQAKELLSQRICFGCLLN